MYTMKVNEKAKISKQVTAFIIVYPRGEMEMVKQKLKKICDSFNA
jgi:hypothetical protein